MVAHTKSTPSVVRDYVALTKPRIISLLLLTAVGGMVLAAKGLPDPAIAISVLVGGYLAAGGAHALNHYLERDLDRRMARTSQRPVASGRVSPIQALMFGVVLNILAFLVLVVVVNVPAALITMSGTAIYVFVYTIGLKTSTPQNIVIGGAAGAVPPMVGWVAVTGSLDLAAWYMFAIIFFWTPPHFWALALLMKDDYAKAGVPMLPVVASLRETKRQILLYTVVLVALTWMFFTTEAVGLVYMLGAILLGGVFVFYNTRLLRGEGIDGAKASYLYSLLYLALLFGVIMVDAIVQI